MRARVREYCNLPAAAKRLPIGPRRRAVVSTFLLVLPFASFNSPLQAQPHRFEAEIRAFEQADSLSPPPRGGVLFVGSSSIVGWKTLDSDFPTFTTLNRGFGGSEISDVIHFVDRVVLPYRPETIVLYAGDNDIAAGEPPREVANDFLEFVQLVPEELPETRILFISIKPSIAREQLMDEMRTANTLIKFYARTNDRLDYVDVFTPMLNERGKPRADIFLEDGLHMNERGYDLWERRLEPHLGAR